MATALSTTTRRPTWLRVFTPGPGRIRLPWIPIAIMSVLVICAIFAHWLAPYDPTQIAMLDAKIAPVFFGDDWTWSHPLGTDIMGRDMLSRLIHGAQTAVLISLVALGTGMAVGTALGLIAGFKTGWPDMLIMRASDAALGFPTILVAMIIVTILGAGIENIILAVALTVWAQVRSDDTKATCLVLRSWTSSPSPK